MEHAMTDNLEESDALEKIEAHKAELGKQLVILAHHYQRKEIVDLGNHKGDSFGLSQRAASNESAEFIVFCGVHFMAESAAILAQPHQTVQIPDMAAGCWMAEMADIVTVTRAWEDITALTGEASVIPMVYMNADASLKAFCGAHGGIVCTSSNAGAAFDWAFKEGDKVFFYPDQHLGRNTGNQKGIPSEEMIVWSPGKPLGGNTPEQIIAARVVLWDGYCLVHTRFTTNHIEAMRERYPEAHIVVHPECTEDVVNMADAVGSTSFIVKYVEEAPVGSTVIIGTEINLIERLAIEHPDKRVIDLHNSNCPNMYKINPMNLLWTLENIGKGNVVTVPDEIKRDSKIALDRMLSLAK